MAKLWDRLHQFVVWLAVRAGLWGRPLPRHDSDLGQVRGCSSPELHELADTRSPSWRLRREHSCPCWHWPWTAPLDQFRCPGGNTLVGGELVSIDQSWLRRLSCSKGSASAIPGSPPTGGPRPRTRVGQWPPARNSVSWVCAGFHPHPFPGSVACARPNRSPSPGLASAAPSTLLQTSTPTLA